MQGEEVAVNIFGALNEARGVKFLTLIYYASFIFAITFTAAWLSGGGIPSTFYLIKKSEYRDDVFEVDQVHYYKSNPRHRKQVWTVLGYLRSSNEKRLLSAADVVDVSNISSNDSLKEFFKYGDDIPVKVRSGRPFVINGRDVNLIPLVLAEKTTGISLFYNFAKWNWLWIIVLVMYFFRKNNNMNLQANQSH